MRRLIRHEDIDSVFSREDEIVPSSGFAVSVMDAVRREALAPPPIPFPWKRALPGLAVGGLALACVLVAGVVADRATALQFSMPVPSVLSPIVPRDLEHAVIWTVLALVVALASVKLSMRLVKS
jgi:hypothetical protein